MDAGDDILVLGQMSADLDPGARAAFARMEGFPRASPGPGLNLEAIMTDSVSRFIAFKRDLETANALRRIEEQIKSFQGDITDITTRVDLHQQEGSKNMELYQQRIDLKVQSYQQEVNLKMESNHKEISLRLQEFERHLSRLDHEVREMPCIARVDALRTEFESLQCNLKDVKDDVGILTDIADDRWEKMHAGLGSLEEATQELRDNLHNLSDQLQQVSSELSDAVAEKLASPATSDSLEHPGLPALNVPEEPLLSAQERKRKRASDAVRGRTSPIDQLGKRRKGLKYFKRSKGQDRAGCGLQGPAEPSTDICHKTQSSPVASSDSESASLTSQPESSPAASSDYDWAVQASHPSPPKKPKPQQPKDHSGGPFPVQTPSFHSEIAIEIKHTVLNVDQAYQENRPKNSDKEKRFIWRFLEGIDLQWSMFIQQELQKAYPNIVKPNLRGKASHIIQLRELEWEHVKKWFHQNRAIFRSKPRSSKM